MYAVYAHRAGYTPNRVLSTMLLITLTASLGFNVKQVFDNSLLEKLVVEANHLVQSITANPPEPQIIVQVREVAPQPKEINKRELQCLAENIYFEAGNQSLAGKIAVGNVTLNRVGRQGYSRTVCGVVNQRIGETCMFSWKCEPPRPIQNQNAWQQSQQVAKDLLSKDKNERVDITDGATHFHNNKVRPNWRMKPVAKIDDHIFYK